MGDKTRGWFRKFNVTRTDGSDGPGGKHEGCEYFVLDLDHDPLAANALRTYAADAAEAGYRLLAADIIKKLRARAFNKWWKNSNASRQGPRHVAQAAWDAALEGSPPA